MVNEYATLQQILLQQRKVVPLDHNVRINGEVHLKAANSKLEPIRTSHYKNISTYRAEQLNRVGFYQK